MLGANQGWLLYGEVSVMKVYFYIKLKLCKEIANTVAPTYLTDLFHMRNINADNTISNLPSVSNRHKQILIYIRTVWPTQGQLFGIAFHWILKMQLL